MIGVLTVSRPFGYRARLLPVQEVSASWDVAGPGSLAAILTAADAAPAGELLDSWVRWAHPAGWTWGGVITDTGRRDDGLVELRATSFHALLQARRTPRLLRTIAAPAGSLAQHLLSLVDAFDEPLGLEDWLVDEDGDPVEWEDRGGDLFETVSALAQQGGLEWEVDADRVFRMRLALGADRRGRVLLVDGVHGTVAVRRTVEGVINDLLGVGGGEDPTRAEAWQAEDADAIVAFRRRQGTRVYPRLTGASAIRPRVQRDVRLLARPLASVTLTLAPAGWSGWGLGDVIWVHSPALGGRKAVRVLTVAVEAAAGVMEASGVTLEGEA